MADSRTMGELLRVVSDGTIHLVRQEIRLAQGEAKRSLHEIRMQAARAVPRFALTFVIATAAAVAGTVGLIAALSLFLLDGRVWLAALIVAAILGLIAMQMLRAATRAFAPLSLLPHTADSLREAASWITHPTQLATSRESSPSPKTVPKHRPRSNGISH